MGGGGGGGRGGSAVQRLICGVKSRDLGSFELRALTDGICLLESRIEFWSVDKSFTAHFVGEDSRRSLSGEKLTRFPFTAVSVNDGEVGQEVGQELGQEVGQEVGKEVWKELRIEPHSSHDELYRFCVNGVLSRING